MSKTRESVQVKEIQGKSALREYAEAIIIAVLLALVIRTFIVQAFKIPSGSMQPTLDIGDHILVNKFIYGIKIPLTNTKVFSGKSPQRGDIIVFEYPKDPDKDYIKRVVGLPGDTIEIRDKKITLNGKAFDDGHGVYSDMQILPAFIAPRDNFGPVTVPSHNLFVMGDNRDQSSDSRFWGFVDLTRVKGKAFIIYWSWNSDRFRVRWGRIGHMVK
ncbi:MAG: signal peptidase I [Pseudomonadota bacterium]